MAHISVRKSISVRPFSLSSILCHFRWSTHSTDTAHSKEFTQIFAAFIGAKVFYWNAIRDSVCYTRNIRLRALSSTPKDVIDTKNKDGRARKVPREGPLQKLMHKYVQRDHGFSTVGQDIFFEHGMRCSSLRTKRHGQT